MNIKINDTQNDQKLFTFYKQKQLTIQNKQIIQNQNHSLQKNNCPTDSLKIQIKHLPQVELKIQIAKEDNDSKFKKYLPASLVKRNTHKKEVKIQSGDIILQKNKFNSSKQSTNSQLQYNASLKSLLSQQNSLYRSKKYSNKTNFKMRTQESKTVKNNAQKQLNYLNVSVNTSPKKQLSNSREIIQYKYSIDSQATILCSKNRSLDLIKQKPQVYKKQKKYISKKHTLLQKINQFQNSYRNSIISQQKQHFKILNKNVKLPCLNNYKEICARNVLPITNEIIKQRKFAYLNLAKQQKQYKPQRKQAVLTQKKQKSTVYKLFNKNFINSIQKALPFSKKNSSLSRYNS